MSSLQVRNWKRCRGLGSSWMWLHAHGNRPEIISRDHLLPCLGSCPACLCLPLLVVAFWLPEDVSPRPFCRHHSLSLSEESKAFFLGPHFVPPCVSAFYISISRIVIFMMTHFETVEHFCFPLEIYFISRLLVLPLECLLHQSPPLGAFFTLRQATVVMPGWSISASTWLPPGFSYSLCSLIFEAQI